MPISTATFGLTGDIDTYTVPATGLYDISAIGASGGNGRDSKGGLAADVSGDVQLTAGEVVRIAVGGSGRSGIAGGGGGGSFVVAPGNVPLVVAGGGGGGGGLRVSGEPNDGGDGNGIATSGGGGGVEGRSGGGGGGGLLGNGGHGLPEGGGGGSSFVNGAAGGDSRYHVSRGGFGGGGASGQRAFAGGGGGGGFSGGNGGEGDSDLGPAGGGGGTSFDSGTDQQFNVASVPGDGAVTLSLLAAAPVISGTQAGQATTDNKPVEPFSNVTIADANPGAPTDTVAVLLTNPGNGALSDPNAATDGGTLIDGVFRMGGSAAAVTKAVDGLVFTPTAGQVPAGQTVTTSFVISDANSLGFTAIDSSTSVVATAVTSETIGEQASPGPFLAAGSGAGATGPSEAAAQAVAGQASGDFFAGKLGALDLLQDFARGLGTGASSAFAGLLQAAWSAETTAPQFTAGGCWTDIEMAAGGNYASTAAAFRSHY